MLKQLRDVGFRASTGHQPAPPPERIVATEKCLKDPSVVYIGRGCRKLGLAASRWGNPFRIADGMPRAEVIKKFKRRLLGDTVLMDQLESLGGKRLACHCPLDLPCHGDVLKELYEE